MNPAPTTPTRHDAQQLPWEAAGRRVVLFDGVCVLCNRWVDFILARERDQELYFAPLQSELGQRVLESLGRSATDFDTLLFVDRGRVWQRSSAVLRIVRHLRWPWRAASVLAVVPRLLRDAVYRWVARLRYRTFGKSDVCRLPTADIARRFL